MDEIVFYNVKTRQKVAVPVSDVKKTKFERTNKDGSIQIRYGFRAVYEGTKLTKFCSKDDWDKVNAPEE